MHLILPGMSLKLCNDTNEVLVFAPIYEHPLPHSHYYEFISSCMSSQCSESLSKMKATTLVLYVCCVVLHCHAEGSRLTVGDLVFSCE